MRNALNKPDFLSDPRIQFAQVDSLSTYALPMPLLAICALLGIPPAQRDQITRWIAPISGAVNRFWRLIAKPGLRRLMAEFPPLRQSPVIV